MADKDVIRGFNGVSYGAVITVDAQDVTDGFVSGNFGTVPKPLAFSVVVVDSSGVNVALADAELTFNNDGTDDVNGAFIIADGAATFALEADQKIYIVAQPAREV